MTTIARVLAKPIYLGFTIIVSLSVIAFASWLPNLHLIARTMTGSEMTIWEKTNLITSLLGSFGTNFTPLSQTVTLISAILAGVQTSLLAYYMHQTAKIQKSLGVSAIGVTISMLGVGCASCGSVILTSLIGLGSTSVVLGLLPFGGQEFGFVGITTLLFAIVFTIRKINQPYACTRIGGK